MENKTYKCHDCGCELSAKGEEIIGGKVMIYDNAQGGASGKVEICKCDSCFEKSKALKNYQPCEVYSRVVGYIRPVQQWHVGKREEFADRKEYVCA